MSILNRLGDEAFRGKLRQRLGRKNPLRTPRNVLLWCNSATMEAHLERYLQAIKTEKGLRLWLYCANVELPVEQHAAHTRALAEKWGVRPLESPERFYHIVWDLLVSPDMIELPRPYTNRDIPMLYVNHGMENMCMGSDPLPYAYGTSCLLPDGTPRFTRMLETNRRIARRIDALPLWHGRIRFVGCKDCDRLMAAAPHREEYRAARGVAPDETLVIVYSAWRQDSLFHVLGEDFLAQLRAMNGRGWRFILSAHPREYLPQEIYELYQPGCRPSGPVLDAQTQYGLMVRRPEEDYLPSLVAADLVISDFTTMTELSVAAGKKVILSDFHNTSVWEESLLAKLQKVAPVLHAGDAVEPLLQTVRNAPPQPELAVLRQELWVDGDAYDRAVCAATRELL